MKLDQLNPGQVYYVISGFRRGHRAEVVKPYPKSGKVKVRILDFNAIIDPTHLTDVFPDDIENN